MNKEPDGWIDMTNKYPVRITTQCPICKLYYVSQSGELCPKCRLIHEIQAEVEI